MIVDSTVLFYRIVIKLFYMFKVFICRSREKPMRRRWFNLKKVCDESTLNIRLL